MRWLLILLLTVASASPAAAKQSWSPVRIAVECQGWGRTKACPSFLLGFIDETPLLVRAPRAEAQVVLYYNVTHRAEQDLIHLRFTSDEAGLPTSYELVQSVDTRATDDAQRGQLRPAFLRGAAVYVGALIPGAVRVELTAPTDAAVIAPDTSPWGWSVWLGGYGNWSKNFQSGNTWTGANVYRTTARDQLSLTIAGSYGLTRQPPLMLTDDDGTVVEQISLDSDWYNATARLQATRNLDGHWSSGVFVRGGHEDAKGRYQATARAHVGVSHDWFAADDPRGNVLAIGYLAGYQADWYNVPNVLGEDTAHFPTHGFLARGEVRRDKTHYGVRAGAFAMAFAPRTRYVLELSPNVGIKLGDHVDLNFSLSVTKQAVPGPADIAVDDFEEVTRSSYADPLQMDAHFSVRVFWDRTNDDRNNRWQLAGSLDNLDTL